MPGAVVRKGARVSYAIIGENGVAGEGAMVGAMAGIDAVPQVWRDKISEMNACNFAKDADEILALIPQWHVASESDVADLIKE